jgi:hypothetical protein
MKTCIRLLLRLTCSALTRAMQAVDNLRAMAMAAADVILDSACKVLSLRILMGARLMRTVFFLQLPADLPQALHWISCLMEACPKKDAPMDSLCLDPPPASLRGDKYSTLRPRAVMAILTQQLINRHPYFQTESKHLLIGMRVIHVVCARWSHQHDMPRQSVQSVT